MQGALMPKFLPVISKVSKLWRSAGHQSQWDLSSWECEFLGNPSNIFSGNSFCWSGQKEWNNQMTLPSLPQCRSQGHCSKHESDRAVVYSC